MLTLVINLALLGAGGSGPSRSRHLILVTGLGLLVLLLACLPPLRDEIGWRYTRWALPRQSPEWKEYGGRLYRLTPKRMSWFEAESYARESGGYLLSITSLEEHKWVVETFGNESLWIGCTDEEVEGQWRWTSGEPFRFTNWRQGEPNNATAGGEDFAVLNHHTKDGLWNDLGARAASLFGVVELSGPRW